MNKKIITYGMVLFAFALVSATLVSIYSQKEINMEVQSPIILNGNLNTSVNLVAGDGYRLYLIEGTNRLNKSINVNVKVILEDGNGNEVADTTGFHLAYTDDVSYAYNPLYGNVTTWTDAQTWMNTHTEWLDWFLNGNVDEFDSSIITNYEGNSAYPNAIAFNTNIPLTLDSGNFYAVVYIDVDSAVVPDNYKVKVQINPL